MSAEKTVTGENFFEECVAALVKQRAQKALMNVANADDESVRLVVRSCAAAYERTRREAPSELAIKGLRYETRAHQRLLAHRAFVVLRPTFDKAVAQIAVQE